MRGKKRSKRGEKPKSRGGEGECLFANRSI